MAKVWFVYEGPTLRRGGPSYELSVADCERQLGLSRENFLKSLEKGPEFDDPSGLGTLGGFKRVVIEIEENEAKSSGWKPGFYFSEMSPDEVIDMLGQPNDPLQSG
ncbi:hypothetical protein MnTg02_01665 [bacterium MnTg02]|nr:hypothetical protein MnTg02_01665 [bacterium MnTg02]